MSRAVPLLWTWRDGAMHPASKVWANRAAEQFHAGELVKLERVEERSGKSHAHLFAIIRASWLTLPEELALEFPTSEHLRAWLLIRAGHCTIMKVACPDRKTAMDFFRIAQALDEFAVVMLSDSVITISRAKSISYREVQGKQFQVIKSTVMDILADMLHITKEQLKDADKPAAQEHTALEYMGTP